MKEMIRCGENKIMTRRPKTVAIIRLLFEFFNGADGAADGAELMELMELMELADGLSVIFSFSRKQIISIDSKPPLTAKKNEHHLANL